MDYGGCYEGLLQNQGNGKRDPILLGQMKVFDIYQSLLSVFNMKAEIEIVFEAVESCENLIVPHAGNPKAVALRGNYD